MSEKMNLFIQSTDLNPFSAIEGKPIVFENDETIMLQFDCKTLQSAMPKQEPYRLVSIQSAMRKQDPYKLVLSYTRLMMGFLLLQPEPQDILIIGLGGGSLSKYCYKYLPESRITTVEISEHVIALRKTFLIPEDNERFRIVQADGRHYIENCHNQYDVILLDGFDVDGLSRQLGSLQFYKQCALVLRKNGVLVANLLDSDWRVVTCVNRLHKAFDNQVLSARSERGSNRILYATHRNNLPKQEELRRRASDLETAYGLNFLDMASKIQANVQPSWFNLILNEALRRVTHR
jgi:spermidine synthase